MFLGFTVVLRESSYSGAATAASTKTVAIRMKAMIFVAVNKKHKVDEFHCFEIGFAQHSIRRNFQEKFPPTLVKL